MGYVRMAPEREREVADALSRIWQYLELQWLPLAGVGERGEPEGRYALASRWEERDKRWEMFHAGEVGRPFDILGFFVGGAGEGLPLSADGQPVDPITVFDRVHELLGRLDNERFPPKEKVRRSLEAMSEHERRSRAELADEAEQRAKYYMKRFMPYESIVPVVADVGALSTGETEPVVEAGYAQEG